jgi:acetyl-CoA C-acetyltransferase
MVEALIIDACRTPRGIGKASKGALSDIHPQQLGATVLSALRERTGIDTAEVDDIIWGTSAQVGQQTGDIGRMSALDAGYDVRASGVTLDRFCGSGITSVSMAAASIMAGAEDLVVAGGTEKMSMATRRGDGPLMMDSGNLRLRAKHPQSHQGICADAIATLAGISREDTDRLALLSQQRAAAAIANGYFSKSLVPVFHEDGRLALDKEEYLRPRTTLEGLAALKPAFPAVADFPLDDKGTTDRGLVLQKISRSRDQPYSACRQFVRRRISSNPAGVAELRQKAGSEAARQGRRNGEHGRFANTDAERASARHSKGARKGRPWHRRD